MKIHRMKQGSAEWFAIRAGIPTASEFSRLVTPKTRKIAKADSYIAEKAAERWLGRPLDGVHGSFAMDQGKVLEDEAIPYYEMMTGNAVERVGFITSDTGHAGCSPDGLMSATGLEVKCPQPAKHIEYLLGGCVPDEYFAQVQGSMYVTGFYSWYFLSYCRNFPPLLIEVKRDNVYIETLEHAISQFSKCINDAYMRLVELNGGEPNRESFVDMSLRSMSGVDDDAIEEYYRD